MSNTDRDHEIPHFVKIKQRKPESSFTAGFILPKICTLLLIVGISSLLVLHAPVAQAITIRLSEVQGDYAVVKGRKAAANQTITWEGVDVATANKSGSFSFSNGVVPSNCVGILSDGITTIYVTLNNCTPDSGGEPIPEISLVANQQNAHAGDAVRAVGFAADGEGGSRIISGGEDANLRSWSLQLVEAGFQSLNHTIYDLETSVDGSLVVTGEGGWNGGTDSDTLRTWDADGFVDGTRAPIGYVYCVAISPDNDWTVASGFYGNIVVYTTSDLLLNVTQATKKKRTKALEFSPDGNILASTSTAGRIQLWSFPKYDCSPTSCELDLLPVTLSHSGSWSFPVDFSPDSTSDVTKIVSGTDSGVIKLWTIENLAYARPGVSFISVESGAVYSLAWSPDGSMIVVGGDGVITVYDAGNLEILLQKENAHASRVNDVAFSPDSSLIVSGGNDGALKLWSLAVQ
jgi:WD40 repeat protein